MTPKFLSIICTCIFIQICSSKTPSCNKLIKFGDQEYVERELLTVDGWPEYMAKDFKNSDIYYSVNEVDESDIPYVNLYRLKNGSEEPELVEVNGIPAQSAGVDNKNGIVYIGTHRGLYKLVAGEPEFIGYRKLDIISITVSKDGEDVYLITYPRSVVVKFNARTVTKKRFTEIPKATMLLVDSEKNLYYTNDSAHLIKLSPNNVRYSYERVFIDNLLENSFGIDSSDNVYIATGKIVSLLKDNALTSIAELTYAPEFIIFDENDDITIGAENEIYSLTKVSENNKGNCE